jgi:MHS family shikimate/dehydroshikimate transporter-like MFS transporter
MLTTTLIMMGIATTAIGLLPTYDQIGIWAPLALVFLRIVQGFGVGGEWGGAVLLVTEYAPEGKRGFYGSWPQVGVPMGSLLGAAAFAIASAVLSPEQFLAWGWRIPFVLSVVLVGIGMYIRLRIEETPAFSKVHDTHTEARKPILDVLRYYWKNVLIAMAARLGENAIYYIFTVFILAYGTQKAGLDRSTLLNAVLVATALEVVLIPVFGALSDKVGRRPVYMTGAIGGALAAFPLFWFTDTGSGVWATVGISLAAIAHAAMYGPQAAFFSELFGTRVRYSGASLGYQLASVVAGGLSPLIAALLLAEYGSGTPIAIYIAVLCLITAAGVWFAAETRTVSLTAVQPEEQRLLSDERGTATT